MGEGHLAWPGRGLLPLPHPKWSDLPSSGAGAAQNGGRFNRPGVEAVDLAREVETAHAEYRQDSAIVPPGTLVAYRLSVDEVVDFSAGYDPLGGWTPPSRNWLASGRQSPGLTARCRQLGASPTISSSQVGAGCCSPQPVRAVVRTSSCSRPTSRRRTGLSRMTLRRVFRKASPDWPTAHHARSACDSRRRAGVHHSRFSRTVANDGIGFIAEVSESKDGAAEERRRLEGAPLPFPDPAHAPLRLAPIRPPRPIRSRAMTAPAPCVDR